MVPKLNALIRACLWPGRRLYGLLCRRFPDGLPHYRLKRRLAAAAFILGILAAANAVSFYAPRQASFSYAGATCLANPVLFPNLIHSRSSQSFSARPEATIYIAGYPVFSDRTCLKLERPAGSEAETVRLSAVLPLASKHVRVTAPEPPQATGPPGGRPVATQGPIMFKLASADTTFSYTLTAGSSAVGCQPVAGNSLSCDASRLNLTQAAKYDFKLQRQLGRQPAGTAYSASLTTVTPVAVTGSSIAAGQLVFDKPGELTLALSRPAAKAAGVSLVHINGDKRQPLAISHQLVGDKLIVRFTQALPRNSKLQLSAERIDAADGGFLADAYKLDFATSGGPKATGSTIGSSRVPPGSNLTIRFDSALLPGQAFDRLIYIEVGGKPLPAAVSVSGNSASLRLAGIGACTAFTVKVSDSLQNVHGISGGNAWQFQSRTLCQQVFSIGSSVQGRAITAYKFGSGASSVIFVGGTHGDEKSSSYILQSWIDYLESNPATVPAHRSVTIIPILNPDGYAANTRTNANNVDLNRNFPSNNWKQSVTMPDKSTNPNGGGNAPLSEPESRALAGYTSSQSPRLVLTYHATGGVVIPNDAGDSVALAKQYDSNSNLYFQPNSNTAAIFEYDTTGSYEDWLRDKPGIPALLIEHVTMTGNEFQRQVKAMSLMAGL